MRKVKLNIPSLDEITIGQYQDIEKCLALNGDTVFSQQRIISIIYGLSIDQVKEIDQATVFNVFMAIKKVLNDTVEFQPTFEFNGVRYGFIPNLNKISSGEYADLETHLKEHSSYHKAMAVMYRPIKEEVAGKYRIVKYQGTSDTANAAKQMPLSYFIGAMVFFWTLERELWQCSQNFIEKEAMSLSKTFQQEQHTQTNGGGISPLTELLEEVLKGLNTQQSQLFSNYLQG